jgi:hypothetical protein
MIIIMRTTIIPSIKPLALSSLSIISMRPLALSSHSRIYAARIFLCAAQRDIFLAQPNCSNLMETSANKQSHLVVVLFSSNGELWVVEVAGPLVPIGSYIFYFHLIIEINSENTHTHTHTHTHTAFSFCTTPKYSRHFSIAGNCCSSLSDCGKTRKQGPCLAPQHPHTHTHTHTHTTHIHTHAYTQTPHTHTHTFEKSTSFEASSLLSIS